MDIPKKPNTSGAPLAPIFVKKQKIHVMPANQPREVPNNKKTVVGPNNSIKIATFNTKNTDLAKNRLFYP